MLSWTGRFKRPAIATKAMSNDPGRSTGLGHCHCHGRSMDLWAVGVLKWTSCDVEWPGSGDAMEEQLKRIHITWNEAQRTEADREKLSKRAAN